MVLGISEIYNSSSFDFRKSFEISLLILKIKARKLIRKHEKDIFCIHHITPSQHIREHGSMCDVQNDR